jgi:uncharacterized membrane protein YcaP (DUF421 family)
VENLWTKLEDAIGDGQPAEELKFSAIALRAILMFFAVLLIVRFSDKRFLAQRNALDAILAFLLASMLARAINGSERFFESIAAGFILVVLHRLLTWITFRYHEVGKWVKGQPETVIKDGQLLDPALLRLRLSKHDLEEDLRLKTGSEELEKIELGRIERNGELSVKRKNC